jgi:hypothetical protein
MTEVARGKRKKLAVKKRKRTPTEAEIAQVVADAAERAERGGRGSGIHIGEHRFHLEGRQLGTKATEGTEDPPVEQPTEDPPAEQPTEETEEQIAQTPPRRRSGRTRAQVTPRSEGQRREGHPSPRVRGHPQLSILTSGELQHDRYRLSGSLRLVGGSHLSGIPGLQRVSTYLCTRTSTEPMLTAGLHLDLRESVDWRL